MKRSKNNGQGLVEFALILPILLLLILGIIEGARVIQSFLTVQESVRLAARFGVSGQPALGGNLWTTTPENRALLIQDVAIESARGSFIGVTNVATTTADYETFLTQCDTPGIECAGTYGVRVLGQSDGPDYGQQIGDPTYNSYTLGSAGTQGRNVIVEAYFNVAMLDPIYEAMVPNGFVRVRGSLVMQNEGENSLALGAPEPTEPSGIPGPGPGGSGPPSMLPIIEIQGGNQHQAGTSIVIVIRQHSPNQEYHIYIGGNRLDALSASSDYRIISDGNGQGTTIFEIPLNMTGIDLLVESRLPDDTPAANTTLTVLPPAGPTINVYTMQEADQKNFTTFLPVGTPLFYGLLQHTENTSYDIQFPAGTSIGAITTDADGVYNSEPNPVAIPESLSPGSYDTPASHQILSHNAGEGGVVATQTLQIIDGCIRLDQGVCGEQLTTINDSDINILIDQHASNSEYQVRLVDGGGATIDIIGTVQTGPLGRASDILTYRLPPTDYPGGVWIETYAKALGSFDGNYRIARTPLVVDTPDGPFVHIVGGFSWPAGTTIDYELRQHDPNEAYDIYWEGDKALDFDDDALSYTNGNGYLRHQFTIPENTARGLTYTLSSRVPGVDDTDVGLSQDIEVTPKAYLEVREGSPQIPGAIINIDLFNHSINAQYDVYLGGRLVHNPSEPLTTDDNGYDTVNYRLPVDLPLGSDILVASYPRGADPNSTDPVATDLLTILAADLVVDSIQIQENPPFNMDVPITITILNQSPVTVTNQSFDVDVYLDPPVEPNLGLALPPGDFKTWITETLSPGASYSFTTDIALYGAYDHVVWARADTSNRIIEGDNELNNLENLYISPNTCEISADAGSLFITSTGAITQAFGDIDISIPNDEPRIRVTTPGNSTFQNDDDNSDSGFFFGYRELSGDFSMEVRLDQPDDYGKWGLQVRNSLDGEAAKLEWDYARIGGAWDNLQYAIRTSDGSGTPDGTGSNDYSGIGTPVWLRLDRSGNNFNLYYAEDDGSGNRPASSDWVNAADASVPTTVSLSDPVLAGIFASSYSGRNNEKTFDFSYFRLCDGPCDSSTVIYEPDYSVDPVNDGWQTHLFGRVNSSKVEFTASDPEPYKPITYDEGTDQIVMMNNGRRLSQGSDANNGFLYLGQPVSGDFDVRVRAVSVEGLMDKGGNLSGDTPNDWAKFGLHVRAGLGNSDDFVHLTGTYNNKIQSMRRFNGNISSRNYIPQDGAHEPVWLRIVRSGDQFTSYYSFETVPTQWEEADTINASGQDIGTQDTLYIGLVNSSYSTDLDGLTRIVFEGYEACMNPGSVATCGEVREASGQVVINASNHVSTADDLNKNGNSWENATRDGKTGMKATGNDVADYTNAPVLNYDVDFTTPGEYYVWLLAYKSSGDDDDVFVGLSDTTNPAKYDSDEPNGETHWFRSVESGSNSVNIADQGTQTISVWMNEAGFELYQILLTTDPNYNPADANDPLGISQSQCSASGVPDPPPGLQQCVNPIVNGDFEESSQMSEWYYSKFNEQVTRTSVPHYQAPNQSFSMLLPATTIDGGPRVPWLYQEFEMPTWVLTPTVNGGTKVNLKMHYAVNPEGSAEPDPLYVSIQDQTGSINATGLITVAQGNYTPAIIPFDYNNDDWLDYGYQRSGAIALAEQFRDPNNPNRNNLMDYRGQTLRLNFAAPNDGTASTRFYLDNIDLEICTTQPSPNNPSTKVSGYVYLFTSSGYRDAPGVNVWIYAENGEMQKTYTIQDSSFSFYDLPADADGTNYTIYSEYYDGNGNLYSAVNIITLFPNSTVEDVIMLLF